MVTMVQKVTFPNSMHSVQHVSILNFSILSTFTKMVNQLNSMPQNLPQLLHNIV